MSGRILENKNSISVNGEACAQGRVGRACGQKYTGMAVESGRSVLISAPVMGSVWPERGYGAWN